MVTIQESADEYPIVVETVTGLEASSLLAVGFCSVTVDTPSGTPARRSDGRLLVRAVNLLLEKIGRWHDGEVTDAARGISPLRPHDLRHTFAYRLAAQTGKDAYELERRLGHGSQRYIKRYTNLPEDVAAEYVEGF